MAAPGTGTIGAPPIPSLFLGARIAEPSERFVLSEVLAALAAAGREAVILANFEVGRQIDLLVVTVEAVVVVEVKTSRTPIEGDLDGPWSRLDYSGEWARYGNAYKQALDAKHHLRDAMRAFTGSDVAYPDAVVVYVDGVPAGSSLTSGDFKCRVTDLQGLIEALGQSAETTQEWALDDWRGFARTRGMEETTAARALQSPQMDRAQAVLDGYCRAVLAEHRGEAERWLGDPDLDAAILAAADQGLGCVISGPTGCGKTLMGKRLAVARAMRGDPVIHIAATAFDGQWADTLKRELALLNDVTPSVLIRAMRDLAVCPYLILDGVNELGADAATALRGVRALARRLQARVVLTTQGAVPRGFEGLALVALGPPDLTLKTRIAERAGGRSHPALNEVLAVVASGMEAEMVGRVGADLVGDLTRLGLVDQYVRQRLGGHGRAGFAGLRRLAVELYDRLAYSMSETAFDALMRAEGVGFETSDAMLASGLLLRRSGRIAFGHEILFSGCLAFGLAADAIAQPEAVGLALAGPILGPVGTDLLAALEDEGALESILGAASDPKLISRTAAGASGAAAARIARRLLDEIEITCLDEIRQLTLDLDPAHPHQLLQWSPQSLRAWTSQEEARLKALGRRTASPDGAEAYLRLCGAMDDRLAKETARLRPAAQAAGVSLRSGAFALAYYGFGARCGFGLIGHQHRRIVLSPTRPIPEPDWTSLSSGQLHFALESRDAGTPAEREIFASLLTTFFRTRFRTEPYHVQLVALNAVGLARPEDPEIRRGLVEAIEALHVPGVNWGISSSLVDALGMLGALDDDAEAARESIRDQVAIALSEAPEALDGDFALAIYCQMFDHPFSAVFYEEVKALDETDRRRLYRRALSAPEIKKSLSLRWLCEEVVQFADAEDAALFSRFASLPDPTSVFPQDEWAAFTLSVRWFGRHRLPLPHLAGGDPPRVCLGALRTIIHAVEGGSPAAMSAADAAWMTLAGLPAPLVMGCLSDVHEAMTEPQWGPAEKPFGRLDLPSGNPAAALAIARRFVAEGVEAIHFQHAPWRDRGVALAFDTIGRFGDRGDLGTLRKIAQGHPHAAHALAALKALDGTAGGG